MVADDSYLKVANFKTKQPGRKLLNYQRSFYGFDGLYARSSGPKEASSKRVCMRRRPPKGCGRRVISSSEQAALSIACATVICWQVASGTDGCRGAMTGLSLVERLLVRGKDYRVDAVEGLIVLDQPLPSTAGSGFSSDLGVSTGDLGDTRFISKSTTPIEAMPTTAVLQLEGELMGAVS